LKKYILGLMGAGLLWVACDRETPAGGATLATKNTLPDQESWNTTLIITYEGRKNGVLQAGHIQKYLKRKKTYIKDSLTVDFFDERGRHTSRLTARAGEVHDKTQDMMAYDHVVVVSDSGVTLYTDTLHWDNQNKKIYTHTPVMFITALDTLYGDQFQSDSRLENYTIRNASGVSYRHFREEQP